MIGRSLVDELSEDKDQDEKIVKSFYAKDTLSQDIFQGTKMIDSVRNKLLSVTDNFYDFLGVEFFIYDVVLTGSLANYNWSEFSDIDLHIIIDYDESGHRQDLLKEFFDAKKAVWNAAHDIKIKNYEVELYVQDVKEKHISSGVYSILNNNWIIEPQKAKQKIDDRKILEKGEEYAKIIDNLIKKKDKDPDVKNKVDDIKKKIKRFRQSGLNDGGEYSYENLTFKLLRRNGYIEKLINFKKELTDTKLSVNESVDFSYRDILRVENAARKLYGSTDSFGRAGFITPNGYLLDFSEGAGYRVQDHRNIGYVLETLPDLDLGEYAGSKWKNSASWGMYAVLDMGFIRYIPESHSVHIVKMPSQEQFQRLRQLIRRQNGKINVQLDNNDYVEYELNSPEDHIIEGIKLYFREGTKPRLYSDMEDDEMFLDRDIYEESPKIINRVYQLVKKCLLRETLGELDKIYVKTGIFDEEDRDIILSITNGDNYTKLISDMYYYLANRYNPRMVTPTKLDQFNLNLLSDAHTQLKRYDKNTLPIRDLYARDHNAHPIETLNNLRTRESLINELKKLSNISLRNLRNDIRKERNYYEFDELNKMLQNITKKIKLLDGIKTGRKEIIMKKVFSSENNTFEKLHKRLSDTFIPYLSHEDPIEILEEKVQDMGDDAEILYKKNNIMVVDIMSSTAMIEIGCSSQWCFAHSNSWWDEYASNGYAIIIFNFNVDPGEPTRMVVMLDNGSVYNMYNDYMEDGDKYLNDIGVSKYVYHNG